MVHWKKLLVATLALVGAAGPALAHTAFVKPTSFYANGEDVWVDGAYTTQFYTPAIGISAPTFQVTGPNGQAANFVNMQVTGENAHMQAWTQDPGTYLISTGEILGAITSLVSDGNGGWRPLAPGETPAAGLPTTTLQSVTLAETYVTHRAVTRTVVDRNVGRLAIHPVTHPNQVLQASGFDVQLLLDGQAFANAPVVIYANGDPDTKLDRYVVTDAQGNAHLIFDQPGIYTIAARYRGTAPADSGVAVRSYTTTLTFDVMTALPPPPPPETSQRRRRSRGPMDVH